jgi:hypothetical protein
MSRSTPTPRLDWWQDTWRGAWAIANDGPFTILVVEHNPTTRKMLRDAGDQGHIKQADNARAALAAAEAADLVLGISCFRIWTASSCSAVSCPSGRSRAAGSRALKLPQPARASRTDERQLPHGS